MLIAGGILTRLALDLNTHELATLPFSRFDGDGSRTNVASDRHHQRDRMLSSRVDITLRTVDHYDPKFGGLPRQLS